MTNWDINPTMKKLSRLYPVTADSPEGQEIKDLIEGVTASNNDKIDIVVLLDYAYTLGMARGKQIEKSRKGGKKINE